MGTEVPPGAGGSALPRTPHHHALSGDSQGPPLQPLYLARGAEGGQEGSIRTAAAPGGSSLFYAGCNGAGLVRAEEDPLQRQPSRFAFPSTCRCWSPFKGHATLPCPPRAGDTHTQHRGRAQPWPQQHPKAIPQRWPDTVHVAKCFQGART